MDKISFESFRTYMEDEEITFYIGEKLHTIEPSITVSVDFDSDPPKQEVRRNGYVLDDKLYKSFDKIEKKISFSSFIEIESIGQFKTEREYLFNRTLNNASIDELIELYKECNLVSFTLMSTDFKITDSEWESAYKKQKENNRKYFMKLYQECDKDSLPPFDILYQEIEHECVEFKDKHGAEYGEDLFMYGFICDHVGRDTKYSIPKSFFWNFYHTMGNLLDSKENYEKNIKDKGNLEILEFLKKYPILYKNFLKYEVTYDTLGTSGPLQVVAYFHLNPEMKEYLSSFKNENEFEEGIEDMAFYQDDTPRYASVTHESMRWDIPEEE